MAEATPVHSKLLTEAARSILRPMGLIQKGRSRIWLDDRNWWVGFVEFQPSGWARGSYLNVSCSWLWQPFLAGYVGGRAEAFTEFENITQFTAVAEYLANAAAQKIRHYRNLFPSINKLSDYYLRGRRNLSPAQNFDAGIACGIAGRVKAAHKFFTSFLETKDDRDWALAMQGDAQELKSMLEKGDQFRQVIEERIMSSREREKLSKIAGVDFGLKKTWLETALFVK